MGIGGVGSGRRAGLPPEPEDAPGESTFRGAVGRGAAPLPGEATPAASPSPTPTSARSNGRPPAGGAGTNGNGRSAQMPASAYYGAPPPGPPPQQQQPPGAGSLARGYPPVPGEASRGGGPPLQAQLPPPPPPQGYPPPGYPGYPPPPPPGYPGGPPGYPPPGYPVPPPPYGYPGYPVGYDPADWRMPQMPWAGAIVPPAASQRVAEAEETWTGRSEEVVGEASIGSPDRVPGESTVADGGGRTSRGAADEIARALADGDGDAIVGAVGALMAPLPSSGTGTASGAKARDRFNRVIRRLGQIGQLRDLASALQEIDASSRKDRPGVVMYGLFQKLEDAVRRAGSPETKAYWRRAKAAE